MSFWRNEVQIYSIYFWLLVSPSHSPPVFSHSSVLICMGSTYLPTRSPRGESYLPYSGWHTRLSSSSLPLWYFSSLLTLVSHLPASGPWSISLSSACNPTLHPQELNLTHAHLSGKRTYLPFHLPPHGERIVHYTHLTFIRLSWFFSLC